MVNPTCVAGHVTQTISRHLCSASGTQFAGTDGWMLDICPVESVAQERFFSLLFKSLLVMSSTPHIKVFYVLFYFFSQVKYQPHSTRTRLYIFFYSTTGLSPYTTGGHY
jgi:hypothetical protein